MMSYYGKEFDEWINGLKEGDSWYYIEYGSLNRRVRKANVLKKTKTQIVLNCGRFRIKDGAKVGSNGRGDCWIPTPCNEQEIQDAVAEEKKNLVVSQIRDFNTKDWNNLPVDILEEIHTLLKEAKEQAKKIE
jgi:hypothetical protein